MNSKRKPLLISIQLALSMMAAHAAWAQAGPADPSAKPTVLDKAPFIAEVDTNRDGCMDRAEWTAAGLPESMFRQLKDTRGCVQFTGAPAPAGLDSNGDGKLTVAKVLAFDRSVQAAKTALAASAAAASSGAK